MLAVPLVSLLIVLCSLGAAPVESQPRIQFKICTAEELRRIVETFCMRLGRDTDSFLSLSPYGSIHAQDGGGGGSSLDSPSTMVEILKRSRPATTATRVGAKSRAFHRRQELRLLPQQKLFKRDHDHDQDSLRTQLCDYLDSCCHETCTINSEDLAPYCSTI